MLQHEYELIMILRPDLDDATFTGIVERIEGVITTNGGTVLIRDDWGLKKMAYRIENHLKGRYIQVNFLATTPLILELERNIRIVDNIIRFLTSRVADAVDVPARIREAKEEVARRAAEDEARREAEALRQAEEEARAAEFATFEKPEPGFEAAGAAPAAAAPAPAAEPAAAESTPSPAE